MRTLKDLTDDEMLSLFFSNDYWYVLDFESLSLRLHSMMFEKRTWFYKLAVEVEKYEEVL